MTTDKGRKPSAKQAVALGLVAAGRVQWGAEYPKSERRTAERLAREGHLGYTALLPVFLVDGHAAYGGQINTFHSLEENGWTAARVDTLPTVRVPAHVRESQDILGAITLDIPERDVPADPGWRVSVELTEAGREALAAAEKASESRPERALR
jgi:hypothetical protein